MGAPETPPLGMGSGTSRGQVPLHFWKKESRADMTDFLHFSAGPSRRSAPGAPGQRDLVTGWVADSLWDPLLDPPFGSVSYTHLTLPTNREV